MPNEARIFPHEIAEYTVEGHFQEFNPRTRKLYLIILAMICAAIILMFIIRIDVSIKSAGLIRSIQDHTDVRAAVEGVVDSVFISENDHVAAGQVLIKLKRGTMDTRGAALGTQIEEMQAQLADLRLLVLGQGDSGLKSQVYMQQYAFYRQKLSTSGVRAGLAGRNLGRFSRLRSGGAISPAEYDKYAYEAQSANAEVTLVKEQQMSQWQADLTRLQQQMTDLGVNEIALEERKNLYEIRAPLSGNVIGLKGIAPGSYISPAETIGEISPDSGLIVETYVLPKDIGLIQQGGQVRMQVDAFDYNAWGMLKGVVTSVSDDAYTDKGGLYFKVRIAVDKPQLKLRNGFVGRIKKGMSVQARFLVTRRSLYQLLYDSAEDWLNPKDQKDGIRTAEAQK